MAKIKRRKQERDAQSPATGKVPAATSTQNSSGLPGTLTANDIRWLGEEADGHRGKPLRAVFRGGAAKPGLVPAAEQGVQDVTALTVLVDTPHEGEGLRGQATLAFKLDGKYYDVPDADCALVTQSAFDKFLVPYYTRMWPLEQIIELQQKVFAEGIVGVMHLPPSKSYAVKEGDPPKVVFGILKTAIESSQAFDPTNPPSGTPSL